MLWQGQRESDNVDDRRGISGGGIAAGGGILGIIAFVINMLLGGDPSQVQMPGQNQPQTQQEQGVDEQRAHFVRVVLAQTEDVWTDYFNKMGKTYTKPTLVLFRNSTQSACGGASAATGPFYCPGDQEVYIDLSFYDELANRFGASGDGAMAYVIAHEVGHHIQKLLGVSDKMDRLRSQLSETEFNKYSVMLELQADFYAGVWAHYDQQRGVWESKDAESALNAAHAIGDDALQKQAQGYVVPESFTHGTSAQRMYWFKKGYDTGDINQGDTFHASDLQ
jgi:predicted metalloprotease